MAVLAERSRAACEEDTTDLDGPALLGLLIDEEVLLPPGGLRVRDTTSGVERDLQGFRDVVRTWVQGVARTPDQADELVTALTTGFQIDRATDLV